ncbi:MAG TPA: cytochrome c biogenesis protein ResB [Candidatus Nanopelagicaceae bacterium]|jgi:cytochrome c biogenesis protein|nr:cytochrome c biogenesis protein ResB [Candidatus Nanopelagicaceae bacterium]
MSAPELGTTSLLRYLWRQLTSMRTALILLLLLGVASIPGSIFPQRTQSPLKVREYFDDDPNGAKWLDRFYLFDVYGSPWFSAIYLLLFISLVGCVLPRSFHYFKEIFKAPPAAPSILNTMESFQVSPASLERAEAWLKKNRFRISKTSDSISAEKGYLRETGNLLFHLSLIVVLLGIAGSSVFGMRGEAIVNVGERFINTPTNYDNLTPGRFFSLESLPTFTIRVNNFSATYDRKTSQALDYELKVTTKDSLDSSEVNQIVKVNKPLTFGSTRVYLQANGYSPLVTVRDSAGIVKFEGPVPFLPQDSNLSSIGAIKVPDMEPQIGFVSSFFPTAARDEVRGGFSSFPELLDPRLLVSVWKGDLKMDDGVPQSIYRIDTTDMERIGLWALSIGESYSFEVGSITLNGVVPWVNLQVVRDPGKQYALIGSILAIVGLLISLFIRQRRIWVREVGGSLEIAGLALNKLPGLEDEIGKMIQELGDQK